jgi:flavin reductase (DIM6/NTAB) family NADH-FMN oxidoreductase RutF
MIYPLPAILVSCGADEKEYNALTVSWVGTICSSPAMCYISVRPERHSYEIIKRTGEFVLNLTTEQMAMLLLWNISIHIIDILQSLYQRRQSSGLILS